MMINMNSQECKCKYHASVVNVAGCNTSVVSPQCAHRDHSREKTNKKRHLHCVPCLLRLARVGVVKIIHNIVVHQQIRCVYLRLLPRPSPSCGVRVKHGHSRCALPDDAVGAGRETGGTRWGLAVVSRRLRKITAQKKRVERFKKRRH